MTDKSSRGSRFLRIQSAESAEHSHFGNFALISHTRYSPCGASRRLPGVPRQRQTPRALFGYLSRALNQFQKYRRRSRGQAKNKRRVATSGICARARARTRTPGMLAKVSSVVSWRRKCFAFSFSSFLTRSCSSFPSRFLSLSLPFLHGHAEHRPWIIRIYTQGTHNVSVYNYAKAANYRRIN